MNGGAHAVALGLALGLGAGLAPGPMLSLVVVSSLRGGTAAGARVALAPLLSDLPVVVLSLTLVSGLPDPAARVLSAAGGLVVVWFGVQAVRQAGADGTGDGRSLLRAMAVNVLSPHPWLFWIGVGAPLTVAAWQHSRLAAAGFITAFYLLLVGSKIGVAAVVGAGRRRLGERTRRIMGVLAGALMVLSGLVLVVGSVQG